MEKLIAISDLFEISLDELVMGKKAADHEETSKTEAAVNFLEEKVMTAENKRRVKKGMKVAGIAAAVIFAIDFISMIVYFLIYGVPQ